MNLNEEAIRLHTKLKGKIEVGSKAKIRDIHDLSLLYTPGVAEPCRRIYQDKEKVYQYTSRGNLVAVVTDGSAVLGLGNIGAEASLPVMEGKCILFKEFAGIDAFPICIQSQDPKEIVKIVEGISPVFGGINLEDIAAPKCFLIERELKERLDIPVFHDDQHGTAVIVLAGLINALQLVKKKLGKISVVINGAGAAGIAITRFLLKAGVRDLIICDSGGIIYKGRKENMNFAKEEIAQLTNPHRLKGTLKEALVRRDVFIGVSVPHILTPSMIKSMNKNSIIFALANPVPEIEPEEARRAGAAVVGTGRSDCPNQINNVLGFPGIFRGALDVRAREINEDMKMAASLALAELVAESELNPGYIIPNPLDKRVVPQVARAVAKSAMKSGVARKGG